jgi:ABC-type Fe3+/spermidine/putrescine transport system ATPase subunit
MSGAVVSLTGLEKDFGGVGAVRGVSLDVAAGEFLTLLGPSGSGKTTTLMMIAGFETPSIGDITINGKSVVGVSPHRRNIGMVFQNYALFPHLTVGDNIGFPLKQRGIGRTERARMGYASARIGSPAWLRRSIPETIIRRPTAARRSGSGHCVQSSTFADGRASGCIG